MTTAHVLILAIGALGLAMFAVALPFVLSDRRARHAALASPPSVSMRPEQPAASATAQTQPGLELYYPQPQPQGRA